MQIVRYLRRPSRHARHHCRRYHTPNNIAAASASSIVSSINWVRDRALDHAVEKERDLKPMINIKNLINSEPSKSLPITIIADKRSSLGIPTRPIDFIRKYPSVFEEFLPAGIQLGIHPHIKLTPEILHLDSEEQLLYETELHKQDVANRLLKLLMLARINKLPLSVIDKLKWDLGLPNDYTQTIVPHFPDYFQVTTKNELELVCWSDEFAVSVMQKNLRSPILFPVQYSRGFEIDNKFKKWVDDWQKLPYISPYENASNLQSKSDESDKWIVGLMHEVLHLLIPKKTEKDNLLFFGEYLGVRSRFKRALLQHPGIFYVSSKLHTHTVVLREGYKRDLLVSKTKHPIMNLRSNYIHLMNTVVEKNKSKDSEAVGVKKEKPTQESNEGEDDEFSEPNSEDEDEDEDEEEEDDDSEIENSKNDDVEIEDGNLKIKGRTKKAVKFNDSPRRNTPNARSSENDGRRRGRGRNRNNLVDEKIGSSRTNLITRKRSRIETNSLKNLKKPEDSNGGKTRDGLPERSRVSRTTERRF